MLLEEILFHVPCPVFWKDLKGVFLGCNKTFLDLCGFTDCNDLIGKSDESLPWRDSKDTYHKDDMQVINDGKVIKIVENIKLSDRTIISETTKVPLISKGQIIGVLGVCIDITAEKESQELKKLQIERYQAEKQAQARWIKFIDTISHNIQKFKVEELHAQLGLNPLKNNPHEKIELSKREEEVLYLLSMGKSPKEIAYILGKIEKKSLSDATISSIINKQLYTKFGVFSYGQLIDKAISLDLIRLIPKSLVAFFHTKINEL